MPHVRTGLSTRSATCLLAALAALAPSAVSAAEPGQAAHRRAAPVPGVGYVSFGFPDGLFPVGDVDRNGSQDLLEVRHRRGQAEGRSALQLAVRGGTTGRAAWSREVRGARDAFLSAFTAPVGRPAAPGVVVLEQSLGGDAPPSLRLTGLDGRTGRTLWTRLDVGSEGRGSTVAPRILEDLDGALLVGRVQEVEGRTDDAPPSGAVRPQRLDLADGSVRDLGPLAASDRGVPSAVAVPDVSGDGQRDVAVLLPGPTGSLQLRSGTDGSALWTTGPLDLWPDAQVLPVGALLGRGVGDLALSTGHPLRADGRRVPGAHGEVLLLAGRDGTTVLRRAGDQPVALLAAGRPATPAFGVVTVDGSSTPTGAATGTRTLTAYRPDGTQVYAATGTVTASGSGRPADPDDGSVAFSQTVAVSDLDRDGAQDVFSTLAVFGTGDDTYRQDWLDGATGARLPFSQKAEPLLGHLSRNGDDLVELTPGNGLLVVGISGRTGRAAFRRELVRGARLQVADARAVPVSGSDCDDVAVTANGPQDDVAAVLRADGTVRWSLRGPADGAALRQPVRGTAASSRYCGGTPSR